MDMIPIAGMLFVLLMTALTGGFILLFPVARRLGALLEQRILESKQGRGTDPETVAELRRTMRRLEAEVERLSEQQAFTQELLESRDPLFLQPTDPRRESGGPRA